MTNSDIHFKSLESSAKGKVKKPRSAKQIAQTKKLFELSALKRAAANVESIEHETTYELTVKNILLEYINSLVVAINTRKNPVDPILVPPHLQSPPTGQRQANRDYVENGYKDVITKI